jgi:hypothetical protein
VFVLSVCNSKLLQHIYQKQLHKIQDIAMDSALMRGPLTTKFRVLSQAMPWGIYIGQFCTEQDDSEHFVYLIIIIPPKSKIKIEFTFP